ncbi:MAG: hypothetical protein ACRYF3_10055 [Janthinobacterium lividum]
MRIAGTNPLSYVPQTSTVTRTASPAQTTPSANAADYLTDSDKSFLLNGLGVTITPWTAGGEHGYTMTTTEPVSDDEWVARQTAAADLMQDRKQGLIQGDVSPAYLKDLLARAKDDSSKAFQAVLQRGLDFLAKGSPVKHVDTQA